MDQTKGKIGFTAGNFDLIHPGYIYTFEAAKKECDYFCPEAGDDVVSESDYLDLTSGYIERVKHQLPKQGSRDPWINSQNYLKDITQVRFKSLEDEDLKFKKVS